MTLQSGAGQTATTLWIGDRDHPEFADFAKAVAEIDDAIFFADRSAAEAWQRELQAPLEAIVLAASYQGEFSQDRVNVLRCLAPLAHVFVVVGSLAQDEQRTGRPLVGVTRVGWLTAPAIWRDHAGVRRYDPGSLFCQPATIGGEERIIAQAGVGEELYGRAVVHSQDPRAASLLIKALETLGIRSSNLENDNDLPLDLLVWDDSTGADMDHAALSAAVKEHSPSHVVAIEGFHRHEPAYELLQNVSRTFLPKPWTLQELASAIRACG